MNILTLIILIFSVLGALDKIFGSRFGIGKEFDKAFMLLGTMALSMIGMIVISPFIADIMMPLSNIFEKVMHIDPSVIPASLFANDMGGASLSVEMAANEKNWNVQCSGGFVYDGLHHIFYNSFFSWRCRKRAT